MRWESCLAKFALVVLGILGLPGFARGQALGEEGPPRLPREAEPGASPEREVPHPALDEGAPAAPERERLLDLRIGDLRVLPVFGFTEKFDSNIFLRDDDEEHDLIQMPRAGLGATYDVGDVHLDGSYLGQYLWFSRHEDERDFEHFARSSFRYEPGEFYAGAGGSFQRTVSPLDLRVVERLVLFQSSAYARGGWDGDVARIEIEPFIEGYDVRDKFFDFLDYTKYGGRLPCQWKVSPEFRLLTTVEGGQTFYQEDDKNDYDFVEGTAGFQWVPAEVFGLRAEMGYRLNDYENDAEVFPDTRDYKQIVTRVTLIWKPVEDGRLALGYGHRPVESVVSNYLKQDNWTISYEHILFEKWTLGADARFERNQESRHDVAQQRQYGIRPGASLRFTPLKWLSFDASYRYLGKRTNDDVGEYDDHQLTAGVEIRF